MSGFIISSKRLVRFVRVLFLSTVIFVFMFFIFIFAYYFLFAEEFARTIPLLAGVLFVFLLFCALLVVLFHLYILKPIEDIKKGILSAIENDDIAEHNCAERRDELGDLARIIIYMHEILTAQEKELQYKDMLLVTVNNITSLLQQCGTAEFENTLYYCLGILAKALDVEKITIRQSNNPDFIMIYEWNTDNQLALRQSQYMSDDSHGLMNMLRQNICVNLITDEIPPLVQKQLFIEHTSSILMIPVFMQENFWGFIGFFDMQNERVFTPVEETVFKSAALVIATAIFKYDASLTLKSDIAAMEDFVKSEAAAMNKLLEDAKTSETAKSDYLIRISRDMRSQVEKVSHLADTGRNSRDILVKNTVLKDIKITNEELYSMVDNILEMARINTGQIKIDESPFILSDILQRLFSMTKYRLEYDKIKFTSIVDTEVKISYIGDEEKIIQLLYNSLIYALKRTLESKEVNLYIVEAPLDDNRVILQFDIAGASITEEEINDLFLSPENIKPKQKTDAIGIIIARHLIEQMGGKMWVTSRQDKGLRLTFTINVGIEAVEDEV